jgi:hypothetical protein
MMVAKSPEQRTTVDELERLLERVKALEEKSLLGDGGTRGQQSNKGAYCWDASQISFKGRMYSYEGAIWYCCKPTRARPCDGPDWMLAVKGDAHG